MAKDAVGAHFSALMDPFQDVDLDI
jgi:hypothetical protein